MRGLYFSPRRLIQPHQEFPQSSPANMSATLYFFCATALATTPHSRIVCSVSHWGNEGQGPQRMSWHASLSLSTADTQPCDMHTHSSLLHTFIYIKNTHFATILACRLLRREGVWGHMSSTFLGLCKCVPQVRQVVYQAGWALLKVKGLRHRLKKRQGVCVCVEG